MGYYVHLNFNDEIINQIFDSSCPIGWVEPIAPPPTTEIRERTTGLPLYKLVNNSVVALDLTDEVKKASRKQKLQIIRMQRVPLLDELDHAFQDSVLGSSNVTLPQLKTYKKALKDITDPYKADPTLLDTQEVVWPAKPF